ncbi:MAG TPA: aspartate aminotransferase family protein [Candidatus Limnocylindria bacterium]|nr:aspartate aminotransferase family protein [Candidatus Limnocylindria bacterium]
MQTGESPASWQLAEGDSNQTSRRTAWQAEHLDEETRELLAEDARWFLHQSLSTPCLNALGSAEGAWIEDVQGRRYLDFHGNSVHHVGFSNPRVLAAIRTQLDQLPFSTRRYTNRPAVELARKLASLAPGDLNRVLFAPGGAEANSMALQLARLATGRHKTISMWDAFHGATLDTASIGGEAQFRAGVGPLLSGADHVPPSDPSHCPFSCLDRAGQCDLACAGYIEYVLEKEGDVAAVFAESVRNTPYIPPAAYWQRVRAACDRHGALLILDEIPHALGRTGAFFTCENFGVVPDILVIGKGLGGGVIPFAALIARDGLNVAGDRAIGHFTHEKNPVAAAAALATIAEIEEGGLVARARELGEYALGRLRDLMATHPLIGDVRGLGLLMGVELVRDRGMRARAVEETEAVMYEALSRGLNFKTTMGNVINLTPPLTISREELDLAVSILDEAIGAVEMEFGYSS